MNLVLLIVSLHLVCVSAMNNKQQQQQEEQKQEMRTLEQIQEEIRLNKLKLDNVEKELLRNYPGQVKEIKRLAKIIGDKENEIKNELEKIGSDQNQNTIDEARSEMESAKQNMRNLEKFEDIQVLTKKIEEYQKAIQQLEERKQKQKMKEEVESRELMEKQNGPVRNSTKPQKVPTDNNLKQNQQIQTGDHEKLETIQVWCRNEDLKGTVFQHDDLELNETTVAMSLNEISLQVCGKKGYTHVYVKAHQSKWQIGKMNKEGDLPYVAETKLRVLTFSMNAGKIIKLVFTDRQLDDGQKENLLKKLDQRRVRRN